jgi:hypothetical protein
MKMRGNIMTDYAKRVAAWASLQFTAVPAWLTGYVDPEYQNAPSSALAYDASARQRRRHPNEIDRLMTGDPVPADFGDRGALWHASQRFEGYPTKPVGL